MSHHKIKTIFQSEKRSDFDVKTLRNDFFQQICGTQHEQLTHRHRIKAGKMYFSFHGDFKANQKSNET